jgi:hypothetical protein
MMQLMRVKTSCFARIAGFHPAGKEEGLGGLHQPRFAQPIILLSRVSALPVAPATRIFIIVSYLNLFYLI